MTEKFSNEVRLDMFEILLAKYIMINFLKRRNNLQFTFGGFENKRSKYNIDITKRNWNIFDDVKVNRYVSIIEIVKFWSAFNIIFIFC